MNRLWILALVTALPAAAVDLRFDPAEFLLPPGGEGQLSLMLDEALELRTVELTVGYDAGVLESLAGAAGQVFDDTGCYVWHEFEEPESGLWHGFAIVMDAYCWAGGPGELYRWEYSALVVGYSRIRVLEVRLFDVAGDPIPGVELEDAWIFVGDDVTSVPEAGLEPTSWASIKSLY